LALLYAADRMDHVSTEIIPNLRSGRIVICDRYLMSTLAYQGMSVDEDWLLAINQNAPPPDLSIYLDVPIEHSRHRMQRTRWTRDLYEEDSKLQIIRDRYLQLVREGRPALGPVVMIDAAQSIEVVWKNIKTAIIPLLTGAHTSSVPTSLTLFSWPE
jgi:dTMP kinase